MEPFIAFVIAYLIGSISSAVLVCKVFGLPDPRSAGSGNPGATNVLRLNGKWPALFTLISDVAKGTLPVLCASAVFHDPNSVAAAASGAFLGHLFPVYFGFKGGKGVATAIGAYLGISPLIGLGFVAVWLLVAVLTRYSSVSSLIASLSAPALLSFFDFDGTLVLASILIFAVTVYRHAANIQRLWRGQESKIKLTKP